MSEPWHYIVLLGAAIAVIAYAMPRSNTKKTAESAKNNEMEQLLEQYIFTSEQEHEELLKLVLEAQQNSKESATLQQSKVTELEAKLAAITSELEQQKKDYVSKTQKDLNKEVSAALASSASTEPNEEPVQEKAKPTSIEQRYEELFQLYKGGKSIEAIAKKLHLNKGEVQLIIQLARQEARMRG